MKQRIKDFQKIWKSDYYFSTVFSSAISTLISIVFISLLTVCLLSV